MRVLYSFPTRLRPPASVIPRGNRCADWPRGRGGHGVSGGGFSPSSPSVVVRRPCPGVSLRVPYRSWDGCVRAFCMTGSYPGGWREWWTMWTSFTCWPLGSLETLKTARRLEFRPCSSGPNAPHQVLLRARCSRMPAHWQYPCRITTTRPVRTFLRREEQEFGLALRLLCPSEFTGPELS